MVVVLGVISGVVDPIFIWITDLRSVWPGYESDCLGQKSGSEVYAHGSADVVVVVLGVISGVVC